MATERQLKLLNIIVSIYVKDGEPVSSATVLESLGDIKLSSASIRNEMAELEKEGYIVKLDSTSSRTSGRTPTRKGYEHYLKHIKTNPESIISIKKELDKILSNRKSGIDDILESALGLINESTNTLTISKDTKSDNRLLDINTYEVSEEKVLVIIVTSSGEVINKEIPLDGIKFKDFEKVIKTYSKRLRGVRIEEVSEQLVSLREIISIEVQDAEDKFQNMIKLMFTTLLGHATNYQGMNSLITSDTLDVKTQIKTIFKMIEDNSIWDLINDEGTIETEASGITVDMDVIDGVSVVNKTIDIGDRNKQLTIVGSKNQDYEKLFSMLEYLENKLKGI